MEPSENENHTADPIIPKIIDYPPSSFTPGTSTDTKVELVATHNTAQNNFAGALHTEIEALKLRVKDLEEEPEEPEPPKNNSFWKYLIGIFIISQLVMQVCKGEKAQIVYLIISLGMRLALVWQLPAIIKAIAGI